jgi:hypothetical protein
VPLLANHSLPKGSNESFSTTVQTLSVLSLVWNESFADESVPGMMLLNMEIQKKTIPQIMDQVALSMTNSIRQNDFSTSTGEARAFVGTAYAMETYIQPQWLWLLYPLVMVLLSISFCSLTVWQTKVLGMPSWKSSALAVMFHGIQDGEEDVLERSGDRGWAGKEPISALTVWAKDVDVRLRRRGTSRLGYGLVRAERAFDECVVAEQTGSGRSIRTD